MNLDYDITGQKIWVAGHTGMVGQAVIRRLQTEKVQIIIPESRLDLTRQADTEKWIAQQKPDVIILAAARVGGIKANMTFRGEFIYQNIMMEANVIHSAFQMGVKKLVFLGSSCIYPKHASQPISESALLTGSLEPTNQPYALAKISGIEMCQAYRHQYGCNFISGMPTNLYGPWDNYDPENSHVIPALIYKFHAAKQSGAEKVTLWGSGKPLREFLHVDDLADAIIFLLKNYSSAEPVNIGSGEETSIHDLAIMISEVIEYKGKIVFDAAMPDGTPRKLLDCQKLKSLGWESKIRLAKGLQKTYQSFLNGERRGSNKP